jgi:hypothetical protein
MRRFTTKAISTDEKAYEPLRSFVHGFFPENHPIREQKVSSLEYIGFITKAMRLEKYLSTSYFIERDPTNYYALFFISPSLYGMEKILEVKWQLDEANGRGFRQPVKQYSLFDQLDRAHEKMSNYQSLEDLLTRFLSEPRNNKEVYEFVVSNSFLYKHAVEIFKNWQKNRPDFQVTDWISNKPARKGSFYVSWKYYKEATPRVLCTFSSKR